MTIELKTDARGVYQGITDERRAELSFASFSQDP